MAAHESAGKSDEWYTPAYIFEAPGRGRRPRNLLPSLVPTRHGVRGVIVLDLRLRTDREHVSVGHVNLEPRRAYRLRVNRDRRLAGVE
jgi:hypothetical protein